MEHSSCKPAVVFVGNGTVRSAVVSPREPFTVPHSERSVLERAERRLQEVLGAEFKAVLQLRLGFFVEEVVACARDLAASLIVIAPRTARCGRDATKIARRSGVPVLIAREYVTDRSIVAATDLTDERFPVLRCAAWMSSCLSRQCVVLHNLSSTSRIASVWTHRPWTTVESARWHACLTASQQFGVKGTAEVLCDDPSTANAILRTAGARDADIVVVGTHQRRWFERSLRRSVAVQVAARAARSVLVVPMGEGATNLVAS